MQRTIPALGLLCTLVPALLLAGTGPRIHFAEQEHDFGNVVYGQSPSVEFSFSNVGDTDLVVERISSSCGCAKAIRGSRTVSPGSSSKIHAQIDTFGMSGGRHRKTVAVYTNDPKNPVIRLKLLFNVVRNVSIHPDMLAGSLRQSEERAVFSFSAMNHGTKPVTLKAAKTKNPEEVSLEPQEVVLPPGGKVDFRLSVKTARQQARPYLKGKVLIETNDPLHKELPVRYFIQLPKPGGA